MPFVPFRVFKISLLAGAAAIAATHPVRAAELDAEDADNIVVTGERSIFLPEATTSATKTPTPLIDVPQSVSVISREQLDDQAVSQLNDALRYVPGVILGQGEGHRDQITIRGQASTADFYLDGLRDDAQYYRPLYNIERIEVLKGANAMIFGRGGGGGVVNRVTKRPGLQDFETGLSAGVDSFGAWSLAGDANLPLGGALALRFNATYEELDNNRDRFGGHFLGLAPSLGASLGDSTRLVVDYEHDEDRRTTDRGIPSLAGAPIRGHDDTFFGDAEENRSSVTADIARLRIDHAFSGALSADFTALYGRYDKYYGNILPQGATATTVTLGGYASNAVRENLIGQGNLIWKAGTDKLRHTLLFGFEFGRQDTDSDRRDARFATIANPASATATVPLGSTIVLPAWAWGPLNRHSSSRVTTLSAYLQDQLEIGEHLQLVAGLRHDRFRITSVNLLNGFAGARTDAKWSPRIGLIVKPRANLSLYASYSRSFLPQSGEQFTVLDATSEALAPESLRNIEAGLKWDIRTDLSLTAALFQLDRANTRANDPLTGNPVLTGRSRAKGFEIALTGRLTPDWQASLGYALTDGEIRSATNAAPAGRRLDKMPRHQITAWSRYDVTGRLSFGLGLIHQSRQFASISNAVTLPAFTRLDAEIGYRLNDALSLQLNVENLADTRYFASAHNDHNIAVGEPVNARLTVRARF